MKKKLKLLQYGISSAILIWGAIDCLYQFIGLVTHPEWSAAHSVPFIWFLVFYFTPAVIIFLVIALIRHFIK
ncbi:hypothetical protein D5278_11410 [bacterium 1XD21-13]|nr:hypothetical protein [bacterium 1XD21-13]